MQDFSKSQLDKAGNIFKKPDSSVAELDFAVDILNRWRSAHIGAISMLLGTLHNVAKQIDVSFIYAQRLKKLRSITHKLQRKPTMRLSTMQDIGGLRFIFSSLDNAYKFYSETLGTHWKCELKGDDDYIKSPKFDGYRGLHLSYSLAMEEAICNIEVQIRTRLQHVWATAVETSKLVTGEELKFGEGNENWKRFFVLMSSYFALQEQSKIIAGTPDSKGKLITEIADLNKKNDFLTKLEVLKTFTESTKEKLEDFAYYLLYINSEERNFKLKGYKEEQYAQAYDDYTSSEKRENGIDNVVLVSTNSIESLKGAYPNYFADMNEFIAVLKNILR